MNNSERYIELPFSTSLGLQAQIRFLQNNRNLFQNKKIKISGVDPDQAREFTGLFEEMGYAVNIKGKLLGTIYLDEQSIEKTGKCNAMHKEQN